MAVCRDRQVAQWPGVGHQAHFVGLAQARAQQVVATFGKRHARCLRRVGSANPVPRHKRVCAEQPAGLVVEPPGLVLEVGSLEQQRATRQQRAVRAPIGLVAHANQLRIVGVADHRHMACHVHQRRHEFGQPFQPVEVDGGKDDAVDVPDAQAYQHHVHHLVLVVDGLLAVDAVGAVLEQALRHEAIEPAALPPGAFGPAGPRDAGDEEAHRLAQQVVVGRRMERAVAVDEMRVAVDVVEPARAQRLPTGAVEQSAVVPADQVPGDRPVQQPQGQFERAGPVRAERVGCGVHPRTQQRAHAVQVLAVAAQVVGLRQQGQLQVARRLPEVFAVAHHALIAVVDGLAEAHRREGLGQRVLIPLRREAERHVAQREHVPAAGQHAVCGVEGVGRPLQRRWLGAQRRAETAGVGLGHTAGQADAALVQAHPHGSLHAIRQLADAHQAQAVPVPGQRCRCSHCGRSASGRSGGRRVWRVWCFRCGRQDGAPQRIDLRHHHVG